MSFSSKIQKDNGTAPVNSGALLGVNTTKNSQATIQLVSEESISNNTDTFKSTQTSQLEQPNFTTTKTEDEINKKFEELFSHYGADYNKLKADMKAKFEEMRPDCSEEHHQQSEKKGLPSSKHLEIFYNYCKELLEHIAKNKGKNQGIELNDLADAYNEIVFEKSTKLFSSNKENYTLEDIKEAGL